MQFLASSLVLILTMTQLSHGAALPIQIKATNLSTLQPITVSIESKKALVVVFLSAVCPCSNSHIQELKALTKDYPDIAFVGLHSNTDESKELTLEYFKLAHLPFPVLQDSGAKLANQFKALKTPHAFVLNQSGETLYQGGVSNSHDFARADRKYLREALSNIQSHQKVKTPDGRTLGCTISRGDKNVW